MLAVFLYTALCCSLVLTPRSDDFPSKDVSHTYLVDVHLPDGSTRSVTCFKCGPGTHVKKHCSEDFQNSTCEECEDGYYNIGWNQAERCVSCRYVCIDENAKLTKCTKTGETECKCNVGFTWEVDDVALNEKHCKLNTTSDVDESRGTDPPTRGTDPPMRCAVVINEENGHCVMCNMCQRGESIERFGCKVVHEKNCLKDLHGGHLEYFKLLKDDDSTPT
ncbi:tumor necrosis factor receptor superfamily member 11B-like [Gigantopelta aegis]|uniref:tumor necrosis factor receptor superfamily member 11B-like n=1 Tax=Gigantopelta aegis TaxID=1735272 RepID=UPI001B88B051|nr:tumor necrosis factor receptor superfamily member 11B-like [Gigantopelta aegis]